MGCGKSKVNKAKFKRCVKKVKAKGNSKSSAYAICTTSLSKTKKRK